MQQIIFSILCLFVYQISNAQIDYVYSEKKDSLKIDTIKMYKVDLEERKTPYGIMYVANNKEVTKKRYTEMKNTWNATEMCKPCYLYTRNENDELLSVAFQYQNCICGKFIFYYINEQVKIEGQFLENKTKNWENLKQRNLCNIRVGKWAYYDPNGNIEKYEYYENGRLIKVENPSSSIIIDNNTNSKNKNFNQKFKDKFKTKPTENTEE